MTKEIDFTSLGKTDNNTVSKSIKNSTQKEGLSLFDSLLANTKKDVKISSEEIDNSKPTNTNTNTDTQSKEKSQIFNEEKNVDNKKTIETKVNTENNNIEKTKLESTTEIKDEIKSEIKSENIKETKTTSSSSLLDRMIIEAKKNVKTIINTDDNSENIDKSTSKENTNIIKKESISTTKEEKTSISLLDKLSIKEKEDIGIKNTTNIKDVETKLEPKTETKQVDEKGSKTIDTIIKELKNTDVSVDSTPILKEEVSSSNIQEENSTKNKADQIQKLTTVENGTKENNTKTSTITNIEKNINLEVKTPTEETSNKDSENKVELKEKIEIVNSKIVENNTENKNVYKSEINIDESIVKTNNPIDVNKKEIKDTILANINKSENTSGVKEEIINDSEKQISKNIDYNSIDKISSYKNLENKIEKIDDKVENKVEVKNNESLENKIVSSKENVAKIETKAIVQDEQRVNITKDVLEGSTQNKKENSSLMDRLFDNAKINISSSKDAQINNETIKSNDVVTNIFLSSQKKSIYDQMIVNKSEGVKTVKEGKSIEDIEKGANILSLGLKDTKVDTKVDIKDVDVNTTVKVNRDIEKKDALLDKLVFNKNIKYDEINLKDQLSASATISNTTTSTSYNSNESISNINVNPSLALSIQNRIIGAQQQMSSMMSEVARDMYQNYKPPVTAFRINLFPSQLGHIAILMKNDKENSISISMNMSNSSTLDAFVDNQVSLRDALSKNFNNNETTFDLNFNLQDQNQNQSNNQGQNQQEKENHSSSEIIESITQNQDVGEDLNYL